MDQDRKLLASHKGKIQIQVSKGNMDYSIKISSDEISSIMMRNQKEEKERRLEDAEKRIKR